MTGPALHLASKRCSECLLSSERIVPGSRAAEIIRKCRTEDVHFVCHKGSLVGLNLHCRGMHETVGPSRAFRFAKACNIPVVEVDPDTLED